MVDYIFKVPAQLSALTISSTWSQISKVKSKTHNNTNITLDLSELERIDPEGINYLALLPFYLKQITPNLKIELPLNQYAIKYLDDIGLIKIVFDEFEVTSQNPSLYNHYISKSRNYETKNYYKKLGIIQKDRFNKLLKYDLRKFYDYYAYHFNTDILLKAFYELSNNIFDHSQEDVGGFSFHYRPANKYPKYVKRLDDDNHILLTISDMGIGIRKSLLKNDSILKDKDDLFYLKESLKLGVTSTGQYGRGIGLAMVSQNVKYVYIYQDTL